MKRWCSTEMFNQGKRLFSSIYRRKQQASPNHEIHFLAKELDQWLVEGIHRIKSGIYSPRHTKRHYFDDGVVEQLYVCDRVFQHLILKQLKPTFKHITNANCLHLHGPNGVKVAADKVDKALLCEEYQYFIRADIKFYYRSIQHRFLIDDIKQAFRDEKIIHMLTEIIKNPIDTPWGTKNPDFGLPLRGLYRNSLAHCI